MKNKNLEQNMPKIRQFEKFPDHIDYMVHYYFETDSNSKKEDFCIISGGFEICNPNYEIKRKSHPYYTVEFVTKGCLSLKIKNKNHLLTPGTIAGFPPGIPHHYKNNSHDKFEHYYITLMGNGAKTLFSRSSLAKKGSINLLNYSDSLYLIEKLFKKATTERCPCSHEICCCYLKALLLEQNMYIGKKIKPSYPSLETFNHCKKYIDENFCNITSISNVANTCYIDSKYMSKLFKKHMRLSPSEYIRRLKLNKASNLILRAPSLSIKQIARIVGFEDPCHFSRNFKKFHGISPTNYKNKHVFQGSKKTVKFHS